jgi:hypothetical protein
MSSFRKLPTRILYLVLRLALLGQGAPRLLLHQAHWIETPQITFFGSTRIATEPKHKRTVLHSDEVRDEVLLGLVPGILPVYSVNWWYTRYRT